MAKTTNLTTSSSNKKTIVRAEDIFKLDVSNPNPKSRGIIPMTPWVEIQFRTNLLKAETNLLEQEPAVDNEWTTVSFRGANNDTYIPPIKQGDSSSLKFDNYFESIVLEDDGGVINCELSLYDKDLSRLENIIIKSVIATKVGNELAMKKLNDATPKSILEFMPNPASNINFRVRFGYSDPNNGQNVFSPVSKSSPEWKDRTSKLKKDSLYLKSPWLYFMMMDATFNLTEKGLIVNVKGISVSNSFFEKTKIIKRFALMKGTPQKLFKDIATQIYYATNGRVQVVDAVATGGEQTKAKPVLPDTVSKAAGDGFIKYGKPSDLPVQWSVEVKNGSDTYPDSLSEKDRKELEESSKWLNISVSLGGEPKFEVDENGNNTGKIINDFMSIKELLRDFVSKVPPILRNKNTNKYITDAEKIKSIINNKNTNVDSTIFEPIPYTFSINEQTYDLKDKANTETFVIIRFFYRRLDNTGQAFVRSYDYMQSPKTIVTGFNVKNSLDFIQLNQSVIIKDEEMKVLMSAPSSKSDDVEGSIPSDVSEVYKKLLESNNFTLTNTVKENNGDSSANLLASKVIQNMNAGIFFGSVEILGDPFYLFDNELQPYQYYIRLNVYRNYNEYNTSSNKSLELSYLSGYYLIKKISHKLDASGFRTTLDVQRYPTTGIEN